MGGCCTPPPHWEGGGTSKFDWGGGLSQNMGWAYSGNHFMEGCFMFQWGGGLFFRWGGFIFNRGCPMRASILVGEGSQNIVRWGDPMPPSLWETLLHSNRKNCRVDEYLRTYEKAVLVGDWGVPPLTKKLACIPMFSTILPRKCWFCNFHAIFGHFAQNSPHFSRS